MSGAVLIDKVSNCAHHTSQLMGHQELAMDIEGINLCRTGRIALIQLCTKSGEVFLFDIAVLGQDAFDKGGLRAVLESEQICKVIFDGRADADALYHQFHVQIRHAFDLQVQHALRFSNSNDRYVKGLKKCLSDANVVPLMERERLEALQEEGLRLFAPEKGGRYEVWMERPLNQALVDYAAADVKYLLSMKAIWHASQDVLQLTQDRLQGAVQAAVPAKGQHMSVRDFSLGQHPQYLGREAVSQKRRVMGGTGPMKRSRPMGGSNQVGLDDDLDLDDICDPFDGFFGYGSD